MTRRIALASVFLLVLAACGDDSGSETTTTSTSTTTTVASSTTAGPTTTLPPGPDSGLSVGIGALFEDPFFDSGLHEMGWVDEQEILLSDTSLTEEGGTSDRLALATLLPPPTTAGIAASGQLLVEAYVDFYSGDIIPSAIVLYTEEAAGWMASAVIDQESMESALLQTTDYAFAAPEGPVAIRTFVTTFDWVQRMFTGTVEVYDYFNDSALAFEGEVECAIGADLECTLLSDDGILRPGDQGPVVEAFQENLATLGYLAGTIDGKYGPATTAAVTEFQTDYWLDVDGTAGPQTLGLIEEIVAGTSPLVLASSEGIGSTLFGAPAEGAYASLFNVFGPPDENTGWFVDACDGNDWLKATWSGFTAIFTDRDGFRALDGWAIEDLGNIPERIRIKGGIRSTWEWNDFEAIGAEFDPLYGGFFRIEDLEYNNGRFVDPPGDEPEPGAAVSGFGTGTGAFVSC